MNALTEGAAISGAGDVHRAIVAICDAIGKEGIAKGSKNKEQGYQYRGIDDVFNALSPLYAREGIYISPHALEREVTQAQTNNGKALWKVTVKVEYHVTSCRDGSKVVCTTYGEAMDSADKATNKAFSAAYKYLAIQLFAIPVVGQDDPDASSPEARAAGKGRGNEREKAPTLTPEQQAEISKLAKAAKVKGADVLAWVSKHAGYEIANIAAIPAAAYEPLKNSFTKKVTKTDTNPAETQGAEA